MVRKIFILCLAVLGVFLFIGNPALYAQNKFSSLQCDTLVESPEMGKAEGKFFIKGKKVRMETNSSSGAAINMVTLYDGEKGYVYFPAQNMAIDSPASQIQEQMPMPKNDAEFSKKIIGQETVEGRLCDIYEFSDQKGNVYKVWIDKTIEFPVKSEAGGMKTYYKNIRTNIDLEDSLFELPQGVKVQSAPGQMQQKGGD